MAEWALCQGWLKVTKSTSINDYNHKLKEKNKGRATNDEMSFEKSSQDAFPMKETISIQERLLRLGPWLVVITSKGVDSKATLSLEKNEP